MWRLRSNGPGLWLWLALWVLLSLFSVATLSAEDMEPHPTSSPMQLGRSETELGSIIARLATASEKSLSLWRTLDGQLEQLESLSERQARQVMSLESRLTSLRERSTTLYSGISESLDETQQIAEEMSSKLEAQNVVLRIGGTLLLGAVGYIVDDRVGGDGLIGAGVGLVIGVGLSVGIP